MWSTESSAPNEPVKMFLFLIAVVLQHWQDSSLSTVLHTNITGRAVPIILSASAMPVPRWNVYCHWWPMMEIHGLPWTTMRLKRTMFALGYNENPCFLPWKPMHVCGLPWPYLCGLAINYAYLHQQIHVSAYLKKILAQALITCRTFSYPDS